MNPDWDNVMKTRAREPKPPKPEWMPPRAQRLYVTPNMIIAAQDVKRCNGEGACDPMNCYDCMEKVLVVALAMFEQEHA